MRNFLERNYNLDYLDYFVALIPGINWLKYIYIIYIYIYINIYISNLKNIHSRVLVAMKTKFIGIEISCNCSY